MMRWRPMLAVVVTLLIMSPAEAECRDTAAIRARAFDLAYNLDREEAVRLLRGAIAEHPDDPALHRALAAVLWLQMLYQRGAVTVDHYLGSFSRARVELKEPPPDLDAAFRMHAGRALELAEAQVNADPGNVQARYNLGAAVGLQASHIATVQGRLLAGLRAARRAYDEHERLTQLQPPRHDAGLIVGTYRYLVSTLAAPMRMMAYVAGFGGGRERGIQMLEQTAAHGGEARTDAMFALVLVYNRERQYDDALRILGDLRRLYPRNRLVVLETGSTALRAGRAAQAEALFTEGIGLLAGEKRTPFPGEEALWRYKRGAARVSLNQPDAAKADLKVATASGAPAWVSGRAHLELARLALRGGDSAQARELATRADSLCRAGDDAPCVDDSRTILRNARGR
jgi:tetratricopeptide (TPR) repeat protein